MSESETPQQRALRIVRLEVERSGGTPGEVTLSTPLRDLGFDSLDLLELQVSLEDEFDVEIPAPVVQPDWIVAGTTVGELILQVVGREQGSA